MIFVYDVFFTKVSSSFLSGIFYYFSISDYTVILFIYFLFVFVSSSIIIFLILWFDRLFLFRGHHYSWTNLFCLFSKADSTHTFMHTNPVPPFLFSSWTKICLRFFARRRWLCAEIFLSINHTNLVFVFFRKYRLCISLSKQNFLMIYAMYRVTAIALSSSALNTCRLQHWRSPCIIYPANRLQVYLALTLESPSC